MNKKILVTGFGAFGNNKINPTELILKKLNLNFVETLLLPVSFEKSFPELEQYLKDHNDYTHIIHLGLAADRDFISIEKVALNHKNATIPDIDGNKPIAQKVINDNSLPDGIFSRISTDLFLEVSKEFELNGYISYHAGTYVCNDLLYKSLITYPKLKTTFIHVPNIEKLSQELLADFLIKFIQKI